MSTSSCAEIFGYRLRDLRNKKELSQQELSSDLGISKAALSYYENGQRVPDIDILLKISDYFNVSADYLLGRTKATSTDMDLQGICDYTNLSDKAVENIAIFTEYDGSLGVISAGAIFNILCENGYIFDFCQHIFSYFEISDLIFLYEKIIEEKKNNNQDYSEYEELLKAAKSDCDYFKWHINNYVNQIADYIVKIFRRDSNSTNTIENDIAYYGDIQAILKRHKKIRTDWLSLLSNNETNKQGE